MEPKGAARIRSCHSDIVGRRRDLLSRLGVIEPKPGMGAPTDQVLEELQDLLSARENIESRNRGFVLTGDNSYIDSFRGNILREAQTEKSIDELRVCDPERDGLGSPMS